MAGNNPLDRIVLAQSIDPGAGAVTEDYELPKGPIAFIDYTIVGLGNLAAGTYPNALIQYGTKIYVKDGGDKITPEWSLTELAEYLACFQGKLPEFQDGTPADNKLFKTTFRIPFGRPNGGRSCNPFKIDPLVGWNPKSVPLFHLELPADGNTIDGRYFYLSVGYAARPFTYTKKWTDWSSQTLNVTGAKDWVIGSHGLLLEAFFYQTSSYNDTLTSDAPTLKFWEIRRGQKSILSDGKVPNILSAMHAVADQPDDDYEYFCLSESDDQGLADLINLSSTPGQETVFKAYGGVADAFKACFSVIT